MINCKEATHLIEKKQEKDITLVERIKLFYHLIKCELCRRFEKQNRLISKAASQIETEERLSPEYKENLKNKLRGDKK